jgi:hypothetical protein
LQNKLKKKKMKKLLFIVSILIVGTVFAQDGGKLKGLKLGIHGGIPIGDSKNNFDFNVGADVAFMHYLQDGFGIGVITGFDMYKIKKSDDLKVIEGLNDKDFNVVPLGLSLQLPLSEKFFLGADMGFAFFINTTGTNGGAFIQPKLGFQREKFEIYGAYRKITQTGGGNTISTLNLGIYYKFQ